MIALKVKRLHKDAILPRYQTTGAACFDLHAIEGGICNPTGVFSTGLAFEFPAGYVLLVYSRSGHGFNHDVRLVNSTGVIDSDYRGCVQVKLRSDSGCPFPVNAGDRIAQVMLVQIPAVQMVECDDLSETARGCGGFGSTDGAK